MGHISLEIKLKPNSLLRGSCRIFTSNLFRGGRYIYPFKSKRRAASLQPGIIDQVIHKFQQRAGVTAHSNHRILLKWSEWIATIALEQLAEAQNYIQRCSQFVGNIGNKRAL